jgi:hypothetical protein
VYFGLEELFFRSDLLTRTEHCDMNEQHCDIHMGKTGTLT